ncbi:MAG TPA: RNA 2',3'-cyclic phosphodiesterase [Rhodospirillaceae bacterium]|nr:RNA 2',3'-cyclic phosphodiesterase [Candidatus Neomarinimicrobiota bacterium]HCX15213.1 RNA 2',3'-cyclic phosphodiesterase [Rhodospirillaceae bacterium]|tara:strand:- start:160 stop:699 length:540 start_codon:yes stop_codon:yes gene_type:complete
MRLFIGLKLPDGIKSRLKTMRGGLPGARWVKPVNMHLTLRFVGEVDTQKAEDIHRALEGIKAQPFDIEFQGLGTFGHGYKMRALWASVVPSPQLSYLQTKIESAVVRSGQLIGTRKFTPHVTVARFSYSKPDRLQSFIEGNNLFKAGPFHVGQFTLFESRLGKEAPVYIPLIDYDLSQD